MYVLLPEKRVREYSIEQSSEIEPQITELLQLAEKSVKNLERREAALKQKVCPYRSPIRPYSSLVTNRSSNLD